MELETMLGLGSLGVLSVLGIAVAVGEYKSRQIVADTYRRIDRCRDMIRDGTGIEEVRLDCLEPVDYD